MRQFFLTLSWIRVRQIYHGMLLKVKFVYTFFPKEQYAPEYISVHKVLEHDAASQRKLETLYKLCIKEQPGLVMSEISKPQSSNILISKAPLSARTEPVAV